MLSGDEVRMASPRLFHYAKDSARSDLQAPLPLSLGLLVYEKEKRLRMMMRMHGLSNAVYIAVTYLYLILLYVVYVAVMMAVGAAVGLGFFRSNGAGMQEIADHASVASICAGCPCFRKP